MRSFFPIMTTVSPSRISSSGPTLEITFSFLMIATMDAPTRSLIRRSFTSLFALFAPVNC